MCYLSRNETDDKDTDDCIRALLIKLCVVIMVHHVSVIEQKNLT